MRRILVVDDEVTMLKGISFHLQENSAYEIFTASDRPSALEIIETTELDLVVTDLMMPEVKDGLEVIRTAKKQWYNPLVLAMTAFETVENAVKTMQAGADDFVSKGFGISELTLRIENLLKIRDRLSKLAIENRILKETIQRQFNDFEIIGKSPQITELMLKLNKVAADAMATCLLEGESGTGKDLIARTIHALSPRKHAPFVPINCAAIPDNLIESELFGFERGAFTGAFTARQGKFQDADGGIIFLDEISELPMTLQVTLLRVLEERSFYRISGKRAIEVDVMVIAASNKNLHELVGKGLFRDDLYFRLNVVTIQVPPLRARREDVESLAQFFLDKFNLQRKKNLKLSKKAIEILSAYDFPGNVRELRNIIEDAFVFCEGQWIKPQDLTIGHRNSRTAPERNDGLHDDPELFPTLREATISFESGYFSQLLEQHRWNVKEAANQAGITREWLGKKIKTLGLKKM